MIGWAGDGESCILLATVFFGDSDRVVLVLRATVRCSCVRVIEVVLARMDSGALALCNLQMTSAPDAIVKKPSH